MIKSNVEEIAKQSMLMARLIFVYNAKSGNVNGLIDIAHKLLRPSTYRCKLCQMTHDIFVENQQWKQFRETAKLPFVFFHSDAFEIRYPSYFTSYPVVLIEEDGTLRECIAKSELEAVKNTAALIRLVQTKTISDSTLY